MRIFFIFALALSIGSPVQAADKYLVVFLDLYCGACKSLNDQAAVFENSVKKAGYSVHYVPVPQTGDAENAWKERTYYEVREKLGDDWAKKILDAFFDAQGEFGQAAEPLNTLSQVEAWLGLRVDGVRWRSFLPDIKRAGGGVYQTERAIELFLLTQAESFPAFAEVAGGQITPLPTSGNLEQKLAQLKEHLAARGKGATE